MNGPRRDTAQVHLNDVGRAKEEDVIEAIVLSTTSG
jgi:hypothetical protein